MKPQQWFISSLIFLGILEAGAIFGDWVLAPAGSTDWFPGRWTKIVGYALGALVWTAWACVWVLVGAARLDKGPARQDTGAWIRGMIFVIAVPLGVLFFILRFILNR